jgi:D-serine deaminase-like pyridoxal phosphate-dependent protein
MPEYAQYREIFSGRKMPFAWIDLDALAENCRQIVARAGDKKIRVASKSVRSVAILRRIFEASPQFQGIMCYSPDEAVWLAGQGFDDLLLGYPVWHADGVRAVCSALHNGKSITLMVDSPEQIWHLAEIAENLNVTLPLCMDVDMSVNFPGVHFGVWRSPVNEVERAVALFKEIQRHSNLRLDGVMGYEAQIAGVGDNTPGNPARNLLIQNMKKQSLPKIAARRAEIVRALETAGAQLRFVNGGGTGSLETTREEAVVTELTAGSGFYSPALFDNYKAFRHNPAVGFALEIVRRPAPDIYTCSGGGYIASGSTGDEKQPQPYLPVGAKLTPLEGAGEVQTPIVYKGLEKLQLGDPIFMRHSKAGELCERFNTMLLIQDGAIVDEVKTYRGDGQNFL